MVNGCAKGFSEIQGGHLLRRAQRSPEAQAYRSLYNTSRWQHLRKAQLRKQPLCESCLERGRITAATVCHHVDPATKASEATFFDGPFESQCAPCHDGPAQQRERIGYTTEIGQDGWPTDRAHPSNR